MNIIQFLGIFRYDNNAGIERITIPGWVVLSGQWVSAYQWRFIVTNAGTGTVNAYVTTVQLVNKTYGPVTREIINTFPGRLPGKSDSASYTGAAATVDVANYNIKGILSLFYFRVWQVMTNKTGFSKSSMRAMYRGKARTGLNVYPAALMPGRTIYKRSLLFLQAEHTTKRHSQIDYAVRCKNTCYLGGVPNGTPSIAI